MNSYISYYDDRQYVENAINFELWYKELNRKIGKFFLGNQKKLKVLEIGSGRGYFSYFCQKKEIEDYTGLELDSRMADHTAKIFPKYSFSDQAAQDFFSHNNEKYDIIFMSHVFEHMDIDIGIELSKMIYSHLQEDGIWINLMPNGASLGWNGLRYCDITHKTIYTLTSFNQVLRIAWFLDTKVKHFPIFPKLNIVLSAIYFVAYYFPFYLLGKMTGNIYTMELMTIAKK